jgi:hypothetical protein
MTKKRPAALRTGISNASPCPHCGKILDAWTGASLGSKEPPTPEPGDPTICAYCAALLVFADYHGRLREPTVEERAAIRANAEVWDMLKRMALAVREVIALRGGYDP